MEEIIARLEKELDAVMKFWTSYSHDLQHGSFYCCLTEAGEIYDTTKYGWLEARQVWMYAKLCNSLANYHTPEILAPAIAGGDFLMEKLITKRKGAGLRCYFATTEDGKPLKLQRKPYSECFYVLALAELHRATADQKHQTSAEAMLSQLIHWMRVNDTSLGLVRLAGAPSSQELGRPMMLLNVLTEFCGADESLRRQYREDIDWAVSGILKHSDGKVVREHITPDGSSLPGCQGRLTTPGHALEAGWFLLQEARIRMDDNLKDVALREFIEQPCEYGTDPVHGGLFYFLDSEGYSPVQLEWGMKLWWVHCEALLARVMAFQATGEKKHWTAFTEMWRLCLSKFSDPVHGEWYGYLTRDWTINQSFKGGPYKGCFHVPRALLYCLQTLRQMRDQEEGKTKGGPETIQEKEQE